MSWKSVNSFRLFGIFAIRERQRPRWLRSPCLRAKEDLGVPERSPLPSDLCGEAAPPASNETAHSRLNHGPPTARRPYHLFYEGCYRTVARQRLSCFQGRDGAPPPSDLCGAAALASNETGHSHLNREQRECAGYTFISTQYLVQFPSRLKIHSCLSCISCHPV